MNIDKVVNNLADQVDSKRTRSSVLDSYRLKAAEKEDSIRSGQTFIRFLTTEHQWFQLSSGKKRSTDVFRFKILNHPILYFFALCTTEVGLTVKFSQKESASNIFFVIIKRHRKIESCLHHYVRDQFKNITDFQSWIPFLL